MFKPLDQKFLGEKVSARNKHSQLLLFMPRTKPSNQMELPVS